MRKVLLQCFVLANEVDNQIALEVDQIVTLRGNRGIDVVLPRSFGVKLPTQKCIKGFILFQADEAARAGYGDTS